MKRTTEDNEMCEEQEKQREREGVRSLKEMFPNHYRDSEFDINDVPCDTRNNPPGEEQFLQQRRRG